jgi:hypothetical protein
LATLAGYLNWEYNTYNPVKGVVKFLQLIAFLPERQDNRHCLLGDIEQYQGNSERHSQSSLGFHGRSAHGVYIITRIQLDVCVVKFLQLIAFLPERQDNRHCLLGDIEQVLATTEL